MKKDNQITSIDFIDLRLLDIGFELSYLHYYLDLLERQIIERQDFYRSEKERIINEEKLTPDDPDWQIVDEYNNLADYRMPRFFRAPFIVSLYAVYESAITEIAALIQKEKNISISINDLKGDFLNRAKKYFKDVIIFKLYSDKRAWDRITMLSELRNAIAHSNGRLEILNKGTKQKISNWEKQKFGINSMDGYVIIEADFLRDTLSLVSSSISDLVERYKEWDDSRPSS